MYRNRRTWKMGTAPAGRRRIGSGRGVGRGYSILEILITIVLLTTVILAMATVFPSGYRLNQKNRNFTKAAEAANGIMEEINNLPFSGAGVSLQSLTAWTPQVWTPTTTISAPFFLSQDPSAIQVGMVSPLGQNAISPTLARVIVTVSWSETQKGETVVRHYTLMTFRSSNELHH